MSSWVGKEMRHTDGRTGKIIREFEGFGYLALTIRLNDGSDVHIELCAIGRDKNTHGWEWHCTTHDDGPKWIKIGDQEAIDV
ncbi:hypothetical protein ACYPKM_01915 [Pseudomonas aeruginosa]